MTLFGYWHRMPNGFWVVYNRWRPRWHWLVGMWLRATRRA